jgi:hypothetical protein
MIARAARLGVYALAALTACGRGASVSAPGTFDGGPVSLACPSPSGPPMPRALIGPDLSLRVLCNGQTSGPIASVDEQGPGVTSWSISVTGDPAFAPGARSFQTCRGDSPQVAFVGFTPPPNAVPGDSFDAVATVHAEDGSFADGTVNLHGEVAAANVAASTTAIDFGDVAPGDVPARELDFTVLDGGAVQILHDVLSGSPFVFTEVSPPRTGSRIASNWRVTFQSRVPDDYTTSVGWRGLPVERTGLAAAAACVWTTTVTLHARVLADGGASDGGDAADVGDTGDGGDGSL